MSSKVLSTLKNLLFKNRAASQMPLPLPSATPKTGLGIPGKLGVAGGAVAGVGGTLKALKDEDPMQDQTPILPEDKAPVVEPRDDQAMESEIKPISKSALSEDDQEKIIEIGRKASESPESVTGEETDYLKMLMGAQQSDNQLRFVNNLLRAGTTIGAAIAGGKPDYSGVDALEKQISGTLQVKDLMKTEAAQRQLDDENALRDPNSSISKNLRDLLAKAGYPADKNISAKNLKDMGVNIYNLLGQRQAAEIAAESRRDAVVARTEDKARTEITSMVNNFTKSKDFQRYNSAKEALWSIDLAIETGDKAAIGSAFMKFAKEAQGDDSVVRDGDMKVLAGSYNFTSPEEMITKLSAKARGGAFNKTELQQMRRVVEMGISAREKRVRQQASPIFSRIQKNKMDESIFFDPTLASELKGQEQATQQVGQKDNQNVRVQRLSDGLIKVVPKTATGNLDSKKYKILD
jgi:hypothetical protein